MRKLLLLAIIGLAIFTILSPYLLEDNITIVSVHNKTADVYGAGFFIDKKNILTVAHVVEREGKITTVGDMEVIDEAGHIHSARVVGVDTDSDIAILNIVGECDTKPRPACPRRLMVDDIDETQFREVFYSKNYGYFSLSAFLEWSLRAYKKGEILGVDASESTPDVLYIMHDSAIIRGYSGSPLLDSNDCYMGMNVLVERSRPKVSMAVSLITIEKVVPELIKSGKVTMPFLGIVLEQTRNRVFISGAIENSPASFLHNYGVRKVTDFLDSSYKKDPYEEEVYPSHELIAVNSVKTNSIKAVWRAVKSVPPGSSIVLLIKGPSGKLEMLEVKSGDRFTMIRKYFPSGRFLFNEHISIV